jgi:3-oxoacyl-(acyl-carrier-protein) synthase
MKCFVQGVGCVTALGPTASATWSALCAGERAPDQMMPNALGARSYPYFPVPLKFVSEAARQPRVRRSGMISLLGATAGFDALADAGLKVGSGATERLAVVFAICSGGVNYTRRFYHEIVTGGANAASPLLFPETVYNAAASHVAALLGIDGESYTLVGDSSIGLGAIHFAGHLLSIQPQLERCLVVGTEESEWLVADAFASWRMAARLEEFQVFGAVNGTVFGEGSGAVVVGREGDLEITFSSPGQSFFSIKDSQAVARILFADAIERGQPDFIVASANGTFVDAVERHVLDDLSSRCPVYTPKPAFGETLGAGSILGVVIASLGLRHQTLPGTKAAGGKLSSVNRSTSQCVSSSALVTAVGFNQQINAMGLRRNESIMFNGGAAD